MPNTFVDNRDAWLRMSDIDYLGQFVKTWLAFNAWYRSAYTETQDRKIINEMRWQANPIVSKVASCYQEDVARVLRPISPRGLTPRSRISAVRALLALGLACLKGFEEFFSSLATAMDLGRIVVGTGLSLGANILESYEFSQSHS